MAKKTDIELETVNVNQQCIADTECNEPLELDLDESVLTKERKQHVRQCLTNWDAFCSKSSTYLDCTKLVEHRISLEKDRAFLHT